MDAPLIQTSVVSVGDADNEEKEEGNEEEEEVDGDPYDGPFDFEIVGLGMSDNGRSCCSHATCGLFLKKGDVVKTFLSVIPVTNKVGAVVGEEEAVLVSRVVDAEVKCRVGFVPRVQANLLRKKNTVGQFAIVKDIYIGSSNYYKSTKSKKNNGMASCLFINNIANFEDEME